MTISPVRYSREDMIACDTYNLFRNMPYKRVHMSETTARSNSWKKTPIGFRVSVSKVYVTFCGAAANWGIGWLFVEVHRSYTQFYTLTDTRQDSSEGVTNSSYRLLKIQKKNNNRREEIPCSYLDLNPRFHERNPCRTTIKSVTYSDRRSQYGILSLHLCWLTDVIECRYVEMVGRQKS
jgi:hypothetical protein